MRGFVFREVRFALQMKVLEMHTSARWLKFYFGAGDTTFGFGWVALPALRWVVFVWARKLAGGGRDGRINSKLLCSLVRSPAYLLGGRPRNWKSRAWGVHLRKRERFLHLERLTDTFLRLLWHFLAQGGLLLHADDVTSPAIGCISISRASHIRLNVFLLPKHNAV